MNQSVEEFPIKPIALQSRSKHLDTWPDEDWSGITDPKTRRRLQNRLNQRARRLQKKAHSKPSQDKTDHAEGSCPMGQHVQLSAAQHIDAMLPTSLEEIGHVRILDLDSTINKMRMSRLETVARRYYAMGSPRTDLLLHLIQLNFARALMENARILGLTSDNLHDDAISPFNILGPWPCDLEQFLPPSLQPTITQRSIVHHPWIDLLPVPQMRDNLIRVGEFEEEEQLCLDMKGSGSARSTNTGIIVWKDPWDAAGWEVTEPFARSWGWTLRDCWDLAHSTNQWRESRNEKPLFRMS